LQASDETGCTFRGSARAFSSATVDGSCLLRKSLSPERGVRPELVCAKVVGVPASPLRARLMR